MHIQKHKQKRRRPRQTSTEFWGWKHHGTAQKKYTKSLKKNINNNGE
jgi:hypothetical protein